MREIISPEPLLPLLSTLFSSLFILAFSKRERVREFFFLLSAFLQFFFTYLLVNPVLEGKVIIYRLFELFPNLPFELRIDSLTLLFALLSSFLWIIIGLHSIFYMRSLREKEQTRFYFFFAISLFSALGVAFSGNLLTLYMFYEFLTFSTYPLVVHKETKEARVSGRKYLVYLFGGALFSLISIVLLYLEYGTLKFVPGGFVKIHPLCLFSFLLLFFGFGVKAAVVPLHEWLISAMVAPTPVSALLHAVAVVKAGVFSILRILFFVYGIETIKDMQIASYLIVLLSLSILLSNILAITQKNLKKRLAFSTINNLSLIIFGALLFEKEAVRGALLHMPFHGFLKITLFMCAGVIYVISRKEEVDELDGIGKELPLTMFLFFLSASGIAGIPPLCGFLSKWYLALGTVIKGEIILLFLLLFNALLDIYYFFPIVYRGFLKGDNSKRGPLKEKNFLLLFPLLFVSFFSVMLFFRPDFFLKFFSLSEVVIKEIFGG